MSLLFLSYHTRRIYHQRGCQEILVRIHWNCRCLAAWKRSFAIRKCYNGTVARVQYGLLKVTSNSPRTWYVLSFRLNFDILSCSLSVVPESLNWQMHLRSLHCSFVLKLEHFQFCVCIFFTFYCTVHLLFSLFFLHCLLSEISALKFYLSRFPSLISRLRLGEPFHCSFECYVKPFHIISTLIRKCPWQRF